LKVIVLKGLASLPAKRFRSLAAVAWKTLHAFADHCKSASGNSTACRGKPRIHADPPTPGSAAPAPAGRAPNPGTAANQVRFPRKRTRRQRRPQRRRCGQALSTRSSPARIRPGSARTARRPDATGTLAAKSVLKIQHQPTPPLHGSRPHTAGRTTTCLPERNQEAPATCSIRTRAPARPAAGAPGSRPAPTPAQQLQPGGSRSRHGRPAARAPGTALRLCRLAWLPPTGPKANGP
jgi:hypothetical protein